MISRHLFGTIKATHDCLDNAPRLVHALLSASHAAGATVLQHTHHKFEPQGVTVLVMLAESHASIHTYPEMELAYVDFMTCGDARPTDGWRKLLEELGAEEVEMNLVVRKLAG